MQFAPRSIHDVFGARDIVFDNFSMKAVTFKKPNSTDAPVHLKGSWLQYQTFANRFADSLCNNTTSMTVDEDGNTEEL